MDQSVFSDVAEAAAWARDWLASIAEARDWSEAELDVALDGVDVAEAEADVGWSVGDLWGDGGDPSVFWQQLLLISGAWTMSGAEEIRSALSSALGTVSTVEASTEAQSATEIVTGTVTGTAEDLSSGALVLSSAVTTATTSRWTGPVLLIGGLALLAVMMRR